MFGSLSILAAVIFCFTATTTAPEPPKNDVSTSTPRYAIVTADQLAQKDPHATHVFGKNLGNTHALIMGASGWAIAPTTFLTVGTLGIASPTLAASLYGYIRGRQIEKAQEKLRKMNLTQTEEEMKAKDSEIKNLLNQQLASITKEFSIGKNKTTVKVELKNPETRFTSFFLNHTQQLLFVVQDGTVQKQTSDETVSDKFTAVVSCELIVGKIHMRTFREKCRLNSMFLANPDKVNPAAASEAKKKQSFKEKVFTFFKEATPSDQLLTATEAIINRAFKSIQGNEAFLALEANKQNLPSIEVWTKEQGQPSQNDGETRDSDKPQSGSAVFYDLESIN